MNVIFEGINGSGKTTLLQNLMNELDMDNITYNYISDLTCDTPLRYVLEEMFEKSSFLQLQEKFKTSLYESLILAANHHYIQEKMKNKQNLCLYDRDYISILAYQKEFIKMDYIHWEKFYKAFREVVLFDLKKIDMMVYVEIPIDINISRTEKRDQRQFTEDEKNYLKALKKNMEQEIGLLRSVIPTLIIDGQKPVQENVDCIKNKIMELKK